MTPQRPYYFLGHGRGLTRLSTGEPFIVHTPSRDIATWIILGGAWESFVDDVLCALISPGDVVFDVGANMGYYSVKLGSRMGPAGKLYSFEPNPDLFSVLNDNIRINGLTPNSKLFQAAAGDSTSRQKLIFHPNYSGGGTVVDPAHPTPAGFGEAAIDIVAIDEVAGPDLAADLIKIDVEGYEPAALAGAARLIARSPQAAMVLEFGHATWSRYGDPVELLLAAALGRRIFRMHVDGRLEELPPQDAGRSRSAPSRLHLPAPHAAREPPLSPHFALRSRAQAALRGGVGPPERRVHQLTLRGDGRNERPG